MKRGRKPNSEPSVRFTMTIPSSMMEKIKVKVPPLVGVQEFLLGIVRQELADGK